MPPPRPGPAGCRRRARGSSTVTLGSTVSNRGSAIASPPWLRIVGWTPRPRAVPLAHGLGDAVLASWRALSRCSGSSAASWTPLTRWRTGAEQVLLRPRREGRPSRRRSASPASTTRLREAGLRRGSASRSTESRLFSIATAAAARIGVTTGSSWSGGRVRSTYTTGEPSTARSSRRCTGTRRFVRRGGADTLLVARRVDPSVRHPNVQGNAVVLEGPGQGSLDGGHVSHGVQQLIHQPRPS